MLIGDTPWLIDKKRKKKKKKADKDALTGDGNATKEQDAPQIVGTGNIFCTVFHYEAI